MGVRFGRSRCRLWRNVMELRDFGGVFLLHRVVLRSHLRFHGRI